MSSLRRSLCSCAIACSESPCRALPLGQMVGGTAELFPSKAAPWAGTTIIQAKHTNGLNRNFSETDFYSAKGKNTVLAEDLPRIKKLRVGKNLDHYMLFSNRRLAGNAESEIRKYLAEGAGVAVDSV